MMYYAIMICLIRLIREREECPLGETQSKVETVRGRIWEWVSSPRYQLEW